MNIYDSLISSDDTLIQQIAGELSDFVTADGPFIAIRDMQGNCWISDEERFSHFLPQGKLLEQNLAKIDDGFDPVIDQTDNCAFVVTQLATERVSYGYLFLILPGYTAETTLANIEIIDLLLGQVEIITRLIEKNNHLYHLQIKHLSRTLPDKSPLPR